MDLVLWIAIGTCVGLIISGIVAALTMIKEDDE